MSKLKHALKAHGVDAGDLGVLFGIGKEAVYSLVTDGASAVEIWRRLRAAAGEIGYWPVILGGDEDLEQHKESFRVMSDEAGCRTVTDVIAAAMKVNVSEWLTERAGMDHDAAPPPTGQWPSGDHATHQFTLPVDFENGSPLPRVHIGLAPTVIGWQAPAFFRFGGWNGCPAPEHHVAILRSWRNSFGAEIVGLGGDVLELAISRPPEDRNAAMRLAREQYVYCPDIIRLGGNTLEARAASLLRATAWSFWWE